MRGRSETVLVPAMAVVLVVRMVQWKRRIVPNCRQVDENVGVVAPRLLIYRVSMLLPHPSHEDLCHLHFLWQRQ